MDGKKNEINQLHLKQKLHHYGITGYSIFKMPDYHQQLRDLKLDVEAIRYHMINGELSKRLDELNLTVSHLQSFIQKGHYHHFGKLTGKLILFFFVLLCALSFTIWLAYYFYKH